VIETVRLVLRPWIDDDRVPFAAMSADPEVMEPLGGVLTGPQSTDYIDRATAHIDKHGFGRWAVARRDTGELVGSVGLMQIGAGVPVGPGFEVGWRLARAAWGVGYASEAARGAIQDAFARCGLKEAFAYTSVVNLRSQAVMGRAGMLRAPELDFEHPALPPDHPLRPHLVWLARNLAI